MPDNGQIVYTGHMIDDTANVTCDRGYTLTGVGFWSCLVTGWEGTDGQCDPVCKLSDVIYNIGVTGICIPMLHIDRA